MPRVSVVVPSYNRGHLLPECIESILAQSFKDFEIIIVDDGSTDDTAEVVKRYPVNYIYQENQGAQTARNRGITAAQGEYIAIIDSDDIMLKDSLKVGVDILDQHREAAFSYGQGFIVDEEENVLKVLKSPWKHSSVRPGTEEIGQLILGNHIAPHTIIRHRYLDEVGGFNPDFKYGSMDYELWVRLAKKYAVAYIAMPVMKYRAHSDTITGHRSIEEKVRTRSQILESVFTDREIGPVFLPQRAKAYYHLYYNMAEDAYNILQMAVSRHYLLKALKTYPRAIITGRCPPWIIQFIMTCVPGPILTLIRRVKRNYTYNANKKILHKSGY